MSPLLYILYVNDIVSGISNNIKTLQFADDIALYTTVNTSKNSKKDLETAIRVINNNLLKLGLSISPEKSTLIFFNKNDITPGLVSINIDNRTIYNVAQAKFLGILFDYEFKFQAHIQILREKCFRRLNILKFISGIKWGAHPSIMMLFYNSIIRSILDYGSFIYFPHIKTLALKLERIQYAAIRTALGYRISTPTNILLAESKCLTLKERSILLCKKFLAKILSNNNHPLHDNINEF